MDQVTRQGFIRCRVIQKTRNTDNLRDREKAKALAWIGMLQEHGINLHRPFADLLEDGIHELRVKITGDQLRILNFFCYKDYIVLTHEFVKNTDKVSKKEIELAKKIRKDFLARYDNESIRSLLL
jgi:phage-related protein